MTNKVLCWFLFLLIFFNGLNHLAHSSTLSNPIKLNSANIPHLLIEKEINETLITRNHMLKAHEILGWTTILLLTLNASLTAPKQVSADVHQAFGIAGGVTYFTSFGLALATPKLHEGLVFGGDLEKSNKFVHKLLAFIHVPAMLTTMALGIIIHQRNKGNLDINYQNYSTMRSIHYASSILTISSLAFSLAIIYFEF